MKFQKTKLLATASMVAFLTACSVTPEPLTKDDFIAGAEQDLHSMFGDMEVITTEMTLSEAIARALKYNLDHKAKAMEQALAVSQADLDNYELLPTLTANAGYDHRSEYNATNSQTVGSSDAPGSYSYSADKGSTTADLTMGWNVLDFGVSYYSAKQNGNRALIAEERRRKVIHNLVKEVQSAYWRMVAAQKLEQRVKMATRNAQRALVQAERVENERLRNPEQALRYQKRLLNNLNQLQSINQNLATARIELAALINVPPSQVFRVALPADEKLNLPEWNASVADMEQLAFQNNPDLREKMYLSRISVDETKKSILSLLPGINLSLGRHYDDNSFLDENRWYEFSSTLSWNIFNVFKLPARQKFADNNEKLADVQRLALRMAVLAQVHVADRKYHNSVEKFKQLDKLYNVDKRLTFHVSKRQNSGSQGVLERISQETAAIASELLRYQAYSEVMTSIGRIHSTLGIGIVPNGAATDTLEGLSGAISKAMSDWRSGNAISSEVKALSLPQQPIEKNVEEKATEVTALPASSEPAFAEFKLNDGPGEAPVTNVKLNCSNLTEGEKKDGWIEVSGQDAEKRNFNGWVHEIYLMQGKLECQKLQAIQS